MKTNNILRTVFGAVLLVTAVFALAFLFNAMPAVASTVGNWDRDPLGLRDWVNTKTSIGEAALNFDNATAKKVCQLAGYDDVENFNCVSNYPPSNRCGWYSCYNNLIATWNTTTNSFDIANACTAGNTWISSLTCKNNAPACTSHASKACYTGDVYWYDSCGTKEGIFQDCTANQTCSNGQCVSTDSAPLGSVDSCNNFAVQGWACDPDTFSQATNVSIYSDGNYIAGISANSQGESAIGQFCGGYTSHRFYYTMPNSLKDGNTHNIQVYAANTPAGTSTLLGSTTCQSATPTPTCTTHASKACYTGDVYWYDSCGTKEGIFQDCTANQTCSNGQCVDSAIRCSVNSDCGEDALSGNPFCQNNNVFTNQLTYHCNLPGTTQSFCSDTLVPQLTRACGTNQTCTNGSCASQSIACGSNADCGSNGLTGNAFCQNGNAYKNYKTYSCNNAGTSQSYCSDSLTPQLIQTCSPNQTCTNGSCTTQGTTTIACSNNSDCGVNGYTGSNFCLGNNVYQNYRTYTCNNAGTSSSYCSSNSNSQLYQTCNNNQTCSNGSCSGNGQYCTPNFSKICYNNAVYWYDSCGNQQGLYQTCNYNQTCSNGNCSGQQTYISVQTNQPTNLYSNQAILNGSLSGINTYGINYVWFQWGITTSYGYETIHQSQNYSGAFSQLIAGLIPGSPYHFRAVGQTTNGEIVYGQDVSFYNGQVLGATTVSTGFTNNLLVDSFFLPLMLALAGIWMFKSGIFSVSSWADGKKMKRRDQIASKQLMEKISEIKLRENR